MTQPTPRVECSACKRAVVLRAWEWHVKGQHPEMGDVSYRALPDQELERPGPPGSEASRIPVASSTWMESVHAKVEETAERIERLESSVEDSLAALRNEVRRDLDGLRTEVQRAWAEAVEDLRTRVRAVELEAGKVDRALREPPAGPDLGEVQKSVLALSAQVEALRARISDAGQRMEVAEKAAAAGALAGAGDGLRALPGKAEAQVGERTKARRRGLFRRGGGPPEPEEAMGG